MTNGTPIENLDRTDARVAQIDDLRRRCEGDAREALYRGVLAYLLDHTPDAVWFDALAFAERNLVPKTE